MFSIKIDQRKEWNNNNKISKLSSSYGKVIIYIKVLFSVWRNSVNESISFRACRIDSGLKLPDVPHKHMNHSVQHRIKFKLRKKKRQRLDVWHPTNLSNKDYLFFLKIGIQSFSDRPMREQTINNTFVLRATIQISIKNSIRTPRRLGSASQTLTKLRQVLLETEFRTLN